MKKIYCLLPILCYFALHNMNMDLLPLDVVQNSIVPRLIDHSEILDACNREKNTYDITHKKELSKALATFSNFSCTNKAFNQCCRYYWPIFLKQFFTYKNLFTHFKTHYMEEAATLLIIEDCIFCDDSFTTFSYNTTSDDKNSTLPFDAKAHSLGKMSFCITLTSLHYEDNKPTNFLNFTLIMHPSNHIIFTNEQTKSFIKPNAVQFTQAIDNFKSNPDTLFVYILNHVDLHPKQKQKFQEFAYLFNNIITEDTRLPEEQIALMKYAPRSNGCPREIRLNVDLLDKNYHELLAKLLLKYGFSKFKTPSIFSL